MKRMLERKPVLYHYKPENPGDAISGAHDRLTNYEGLHGNCTAIWGGCESIIW